MAAASPATKSPEKVVPVRTCEKTGTEIHLCYDTFGDASNPPIVLIMGLNGQMVMWDEDFCQRLADKGFYVLRFDNRDTGNSTKIEKPAPDPLSHALPWWLQWWRTEEPYTLNCMAQDTWALVDKVCGAGSKVSFFGISMGGMIAQCATLLKPERVTSLVSMMSTTGAPDLPEASIWVKLELTKKPKSLSVEDRTEFRLGLMKTVLAKGCPLDEDQVRRNSKITAERSDYIKGFPRHLAAIMRAPNRDVLFRELGPKAPPTLVLHGAKDVLVLPACGRRTAEVVHGAKYVEYADAGHHINPSHFDIIAEDVAGFVLRNGAAPSLAQTA
uniref:AB hydrolase-1 domain-containing protein n=1 Tax=Neobodo designis TaxID=312471 RepID=A0A7S1QGY3_NEODS|mmetsp:Transcript_44086/g.136083  ORF Transcript_44086/g.136083 Transcript_44086/m.136083 type:complete len:328 (+) Transcript_44086:52-1035(+)